MPSLKSVPRAHTENPSYQRCHLSASARGQSSCHGCTQLLDIPVAPPLDFGRVGFKQRTTLIHHVTRLLHQPSIRKAQVCRIVLDGFRNPNCCGRCLPASLWFNRRSCCEPDMAVVVRAKRSRSALHSVCTSPLTASSSVAKRTSSAWICSMGPATKLMKIWWMDGCCFDLSHEVSGHVKQSQVSGSIHKTGKHRGHHSVAGKEEGNMRP